MVLSAMDLLSLSNLFFSACTIMLLLKNLTLLPFVQAISEPDYLVI